MKTYTNILLPSDQQIETFAFNKYHELNNATAFEPLQIGAKWSRNFILTNNIKKEYILCAAIKYKKLNNTPVFHTATNIDDNTELLLTGHRHCSIIATAHHFNITKFQQIEQGFLTSSNKFVNRTDALIIAINANQFIPTNKNQKELFSEDLY